MERAQSRRERSPMRNQAAIQKRKRKERREHMLARGRQRSSEETAKPDETKLGDMEKNTKMDEFALLSLRRNLRCELRDCKVKITQVGSEGRVKLEIKEDGLTYILDQLQGKKTWSCEKEQMEKEICDLKAQLNQGQSNVHCSNKESEMKSQIQLLCKKLSQALDNVDTLKKTNEDIQVKLEKVEAENEDLQREVVLMKYEVSVEKHLHVAQLEEHKEETRKIASALKKAEDLLETECLRWQQEKTSLLEEMEKSRALHVAQLDEQKHKNDNLVATQSRRERSPMRNQAAIQKRKRKERREHMLARGRQRSSEETAKPDETKLGDMEKNTKMDEFALLSLRRNLRCELRDRKVKLTQVGSEGRVKLEIKEDGLTYILDQLQGKKTWSCEKEQMEKEICDLKAQLNQGQSNVHCSNKESEMKSQIQLLCKKLSQALDNVDTLKKTNADILEKVEAENEDLQREVELMKFKVSVEEHRRALAEDGLSHVAREFASDLKKAEDLLETECLRWQQEKTSLLEEMEKSRALHVAQLLEDKEETRKIASGLKKAENLLKTECLCWQQEKTSLLEEMEKSRALHVAQLEEHKEETRKIASALKKAEDLLETECLRWQQEKTSLLEEMEKSRALHVAQLEEHKEETRKIASAMKKAEDLLETECLCWQQEKTSLLEEMEKSKALHVAQLDEQKHKNHTLVAALQNMNNHHIEWLEEKTSVIQATGDFRKTLQDMQQEVKEAMERSKASHQAQLEEHKEETRKIASALKKAEDLLVTECLCWQREKTSLLEEMEKSRDLHVAQLDEQKDKNDTLVATLKIMNNRHIMWLEEKTSLIQATEDLKKTLQEKEQEWEEKESSMKLQLEDLMIQKKEKKKWFRKFF